MAGKPEKKASRAERKASRPHEILEAAFEEFIAKGYMATRVEDVATRLGVAKGTVYLYFPTKEALFEATLRYMSTSFVDLLSSLNVSEGTCAERLTAIFVLAYEKVADDRKTRELLRLTLAEGARLPHIVDEQSRDFVAPLIEAVGALIKQGVATGEFRDGAATRVPEIFVSPILHAAVFRLLFADRRTFDMAAYIAAHIDLVLKGLLHSS